MTYHFVLAMFPMLIFLLTLLGQFITINTDQINQKVSQYVPDQSTADVITKIFSGISDSANGGVLSIGLILAIWSASNGMSAIINSFNVAYDVEDSRNGFVLKILSVIYTSIRYCVRSGHRAHYIRPSNKQVLIWTFRIR